MVSARTKFIAASLGRGRSHSYCGTVMPSGFTCKITNVDYSGIENGNSADGDVTDSSRENLEEKINEWIEGITEKSASFRLSCLTNLSTTFSNQFIPELLMGQKETLRDHLEKILKRGQRADQGLAATLLSLLALQLGAVELDIATEDYTILKPTLQSLLLDHTAPLAVRVKVRISDEP